MSEYYAVTRITDSDSLEHYGVRGMKWGVRKAIASGNDYKLGKQYYKAQKKLEKLNKKADRDYQKVEASKHLRKAGRAAIDTGIAGGIGAVGAHSVGSKVVDAIKKGAHTVNIPGGAVAAGVLGGTAAAVGLGRTAVHAVKGIKHKIRSSYGANKRAVAKRDAFKREMNTAFKGTKYASNKRKVRHSDDTFSTTFDELSNQEFLAHYGIKGMKWGVRKAIESGNEKKLDKQYKKAQKKLAKLEANTDINRQKAIAKAFGKVSAISGSIGAAGVGVHGISPLLQKRNWDHKDKEMLDYFKSEYSSTAIGFKPGGEEEFRKFDNNANNIYNKHLHIDEKLKKAKKISSIVGIAGLGTAAITGARALAAKRHTTTGGHAKAVAKRDAWRNEMAKTFKGTKYAKLPDLGGNQKKKSR